MSIAFTLIPDRPHFEGAVPEAVIAQNALAGVVSHRPREAGAVPVERVKLAAFAARHGGRRADVLLHGIRGPRPGAGRGHHRRRADDQSEGAGAGAAAVVL